MVARIGIAISIMSMLSISKAQAEVKSTQEVCESKLMSSLSSLRGKIPAQKSDLYRTLFPPNSILGTCGLTCLIDISIAAENITVEESLSPAEKLEWIRDMMRSRFKKDADVGTSAEEIERIGKQFLSEMGRTNVSAKAFRLNDLPTVATTYEAGKILSSIGKNQIPMLNIANHWIVVTKYDPKSKRVWFFDPNLPDVPQERCWFTIEMPDRFEYVKENIFQILYAEDYRKYNRGHAENFAGGERVYLSNIVMFEYANLAGTGNSKPAPATAAISTRVMPRSIYGNREILLYFFPDGRVQNMGTEEFGTYVLQGEKLSIQFKKSALQLEKIPTEDSWRAKDGLILSLQ